MLLQSVSESKMLFRCLVCACVAVFVTDGVVAWVCVCVCVCVDGRSSVRCLWLKFGGKVSEGCVSVISLSLYRRAAELVFV